MNKAMAQIKFPKLRFKSLIVILLLGLSLSSLFVVLGGAKVEALDGSNFNAGHIIDDSVFFNSNSMSVNEIQALLESKVSCDTSGVKRYNSSMTRSQYAVSRGWPASFTCLPQYKENPTNHENNIGNPGYVPSGSQSAAQIIYNVSATHGVSSKALIVLLQKEQALVTDDWPSPRQYQIATGYGCPDTAPCDDQYYGFLNQVTKAAYQFKRYVNNSSSYRYKAGQVNSILWSPNTSCGASNVYIENGATAALYNYTPYRPNAAALNNLYGTGDGCSAYGNRNFWRYFNDWFGSVSAAPYAATPAGQSPYPYVRQGDEVPAYMRYTNVGNKSWYDDTSAWTAGQPPVKLGTDYGLNRSSPFGSKWPASHRAAINFGRVYNSDYSLASNQHVVAPGQIAEFWFAFQAPYTLASGAYQEGFRPVVEGVGPMNDTGTYLTVNVQPTIFSAAFVKQSGGVTIKQGESASADIYYKNTGNVSWTDESSYSSTGRPPVHLATDYALNRNSSFSGNWSYPHRSNIDFTAVYNSNGTTLSSDQEVVEPGQVVKYTVNFSAPLGTAPGFYAEGLRPVVQGVGPMNNTGTWLGVTVESARYGAQAAGQSPYPDLTRGQTGSGYIKYKNTGNVAWYDDVSAWSNGVLPVKLATDYPLNRNSQFGAGWSARHRPATTFGRVYNSNGTTLSSNQHVVQPGQIAEFWISFTTNSSMSPGFYGEGFRPIVEGLGPMNDTGTWLGVTLR